MFTSKPVLCKNGTQWTLFMKRKSKIIQSVNALLSMNQPEHCVTAVLLLHFKSVLPLQLNECSMKTCLTTCYMQELRS